MLIGSGIGGVEFFENNCNKFTGAGAGAKGLKKVSRGCMYTRQGGGIASEQNVNRFHLLLSSHWTLGLLLRKKVSSW